MRRALKPDYRDTWHHCYNRTASQKFARLAAEDAKSPPAVVDAAIAAATPEPPFSLTARPPSRYAATAWQARVRHWVDGLVIGSELFVRDTMRHVRTEAEVARHRLAKAAPATPDATPICCWRRLGVMRN